MADTRVLRVAMVNTALRRGGAARMAAVLNGALNDTAGVRSRLFHCEDSRRSQTVIGLRRRGSRTLNAVMSRLAGSFTNWDIGVAGTLVAASRGDDVLHVHNLHGYYLDFQHLLLAWKTRPIVWTWHDMWGATGRCAAGYECQYRSRGCTPCPSLSLYPAAWFDHAATEYHRKFELFQKLDRLAIVSPSDWIAQIAIARGFRKDQVFVIPNPVDTECYKTIGRAEARQALGLPAQAFMPLFIASDCSDKRKGFIDFAACCNGQTWSPLVVGRPPAQACAGMHFAGAIENEATINLYYAAADIMVIPTYADNYPNTVIESLACGTPAIGYREGGIANQLSQFADCHVVEKSNWQKLQDILVEFEARGGKSEDLAVALSEQAQALWGHRHIACQYRNLYESLVSGSA